MMVDAKSILTRPNYQAELAVQTSLKESIKVQYLALILKYIVEFSDNRHTPSNTGTTRPDLVRGNPSTLPEPIRPVQSALRTVGDLLEVQPLPNPG
ncbi:hypothetical protein, partial [Isoptericola haloaureus]